MTSALLGFHKGDKVKVIANDGVHPLDVGFVGVLVRGGSIRADSDPNGPLVMVWRIENGEAYTYATEKNIEHTS